MKRCKNWVVTIVALLMLVGEISILPANLQGSTSVVNAAIHHRRRKQQHVQQDIVNQKDKLKDF